MIECSKERTDLKKTISALLIIIFVISTVPCTILTAEPVLNPKALKVASDVKPMAPPEGRGRPDKPPKGGKEQGPDLTQPNKWAVIVGIADYRGAADDLWHPDEDATDMYTVLTAEYGFAKDHVKVLLNNKAKAQAVVEAIAWLRDWENDSSTVVFFFSGHGYQAPDDWDSDSESDSIDECIVTWDMYGITDGYLADQFALFESTKITVWFGSCFSGGMNDISDRSTFSGVLCAACQETEYGYDIYEFGNTLFGYYYVDQGILAANADGNSDGTVTVEEAFTYADGEVNAFAAENNLQSDPQIYDKFTNDLYL
ncbi:MAG: caspase family protein [Candidatus Bathyarchaeota archaeon]|nr:caspase family protein [Candidatus Bathyarchaeota archaeon]